MKKTLFILALLTASPALADAGRDSLLNQYAQQAGEAFSAARGEALFQAMFNTGKPDTPSCTTCHTKDPTAVGQTRAGKSIDPIALSRTPTRFTDPEKVEKWFGRNCRAVLGRECTATEKGDFLTYMIGQ
ncbi:DUF1924 domain-containing protein [Magnetospira thiophila]